MKIRSFLFIFIFIFVLSGCTGSAAPLTNSDSTQTPTISIPTPKPGTTVVTGKMINKADNKPYSNQLVRLAKIYGEGVDSVFVYNETVDPGAFTLEDGSFIISEVEPGSYAVLLVNGDGAYASIMDTSEKILVIDVTADQVIEMGDILVVLNTQTN